MFDLRLAGFLHQRLRLTTKMPENSTCRCFGGEGGMTRHFGLWWRATFDQYCPWHSENLTVYVWFETQLQMTVTIVFFLKAVANFCVTPQTESNSKYTAFWKIVKLQPQERPVLARDHLWCVNFLWKGEAYTEDPKMLPTQELRYEPCAMSWIKEASRLTDSMSIFNVPDLC